jgi:uncharacterized protein involved in copper resistance
VNVLRLKWLLILLIVIIFSGGRAAMAADGNHSSKDHGNSEQNMEGMDMSGDKNSDSHDMEGMDMSGDHSKDSHDDMEGMDMGHEPVVEKPANLKVLGTYGAVNLSFIMIGVWNKWFRRKGELSGHSK